MNYNAMAAALGMVLMAAPAAADVVGKSTKARNAEKVGIAAAGAPKPYWARAAAECGVGSCTVGFGKKGNKARTIHWINCGFGVSNGVVRIAVVGLNDLNDQQGYFSSVSSVMDGADETAVLEYKNPVTVPAGATLFVYVAATGNVDGGQCTLGGTIE